MTSPMETGLFRPSLFDYSQRLDVSKFEIPLKALIEYIDLPSSTFRESVPNDLMVHLNDYLNAKLLVGFLFQYKLSKWKSRYYYKAILVELRDKSKAPTQVVIEFHSASRFNPEQNPQDRAENILMIDAIWESSWYYKENGKVLDKTFYGSVKEILGIWKLNNLEESAKNRYYYGPYPVDGYGVDIYSISKLMYSFYLGSVSLFAKPILFRNRFYFYIDKFGDWANFGFDHVFQIDERLIGVRGHLFFQANVEEMIHSQYLDECGFTFEGYDGYGRITGYSTNILQNNLIVNQALYRGTHGENGIDFSRVYKVPISTFLHH